MATVTSFESLDVYKKARAFRQAISEFGKTLPASEKFRLHDQIIRSSRSVTSQIAEGYGRYHYQENTQFCRIARGSLEETHEHLNTALDEGYIDEAFHRELISMKFEVSRMLNGYINYLQRAKHGEEGRKRRASNN